LQLRLVAPDTILLQLRLGGSQTPRQNCFTEFGDGGDSRPPWRNSNIAATTSNPRTRMGRRISAGLETTVGKSVGEPLRYPLLAKQKSSPTRPRWVPTCTSPDSLLKGSERLFVRKYAPATAARKAD
jgi:hypothetical protein